MIRNASIVASMGHQSIYTIVDKALASGNKLVRKYWQPIRIAARNFLHDRKDEMMSLPASAPSSLLWPSLRAGDISAWHGHVAFAHWIVSALRPASIVELGTHNGASYFAFCNAVDHLKLDCRCWAVDTWEGDPHAGFYSNSIYDGVNYFNQTYFKSFSTLLQMKFDQALEHIPNGSVDLLHIDGLHTYGAVKHDFETWLPKMSDRGVVLFHDTSVHLPTFGVWKLWLELLHRYPSFQFMHSAGLGVLAVGKGVTEEILDLCATPEGEASDAIRNVFENLSSFAKSRGLREPPYSKANKAGDIHGDNVALHCDTIQSSFLAIPDLKASGAVGGQKTGGVGFHTLHEECPWWIVDLGGIKNITSVVLYNRMDANCMARSRNIEILSSDNNIDWTERYSHDGSIFGGTDGNPLIVSLSTTPARYVKLQLKGTEFLHLDEVEVYAER